MKTICECILNILKEIVLVSKPAKRKLLAHKKSLIALAEKSTPLDKKKKILVQQGGNFSLRWPNAVLARAFADAN